MKIWNGSIRSSSLGGVCRPMDDHKLQHDLLHRPYVEAADTALLTLGRQFDAELETLLDLERLEDEVGSTVRIEAQLARMAPIENAIMATPAEGLAGIAVKARVAAYIVSNYWNVPLGQLDLDARAFRVLIDAICNVAATPLPFLHPANAALEDSGISDEADAPKS
jgi:hypothetical protein